MISAFNLLADEKTKLGTESWGEPGPEVQVIDWNAIESLQSEAIPEAAEAANEINIREATAESDSIEPMERSESVRITLFKIKGWPEFKVEMKKECRTVFGRKICINIPQAFQKNCDLIAFAEIRHPAANSIRGKIESCTRQAIAAGVLAGVYSGSLEAAAAALKAYLTSCLAAQGVGSLAELSVTVRTESKCGNWKPR